MKLTEIRDYFKDIFGWTDTISIGKIDKTKDKAICFYNGNPISYNPSISKNKKYKVKSITILLRYGNNADIAEEMAMKIYDFYNHLEYSTKEKRVFTIHNYEEPISLGTDDKNVYEYSFDFLIYET